MAYKQQGNQGWNPHRVTRKIVVSCKRCSNDIECYPSQKRVFCSASCRSTHYSSEGVKYLPHPQKDDHYNWKGGISNADKLQRQKFRNKLHGAVLARDNYTCQICDAYGGSLQVDHIKRWSEFPELRFDLANCRTVCMACHYYITFKRKIPKGVIWGHNLSRRIVS